MMSIGALIAISGFLIVVLGGAWAIVRFGSWRLLGFVATGIVASLVLGSWLYTKRPQPEPTACSLPSAVGELGSICGFKNPEDLHHIRSMGLVLVSEEGFGGRLLSLRLDSLQAGPRVLWPPDPDYS
jgi:hypothetical protein